MAYFSMSSDWPAGRYRYDDHWKTRRPLQPSRRAQRLVASQGATGPTRSSTGSPPSGATADRTSRRWSGSGSMTRSCSARGRPNRSSATSSAARRSPSRRATTPGRTDLTSSKASRNASLAATSSRAWPTCSVPNTATRGTSPMTTRSSTRVSKPHKCFGCRRTRCWHSRSHLHGQTTFAISAR